MRHIEEFLFEKAIKSQTDQLDLSDFFEHNKKTAAAAMRGDNVWRIA